jgi:hypothetical protein
LAATMRAQTKQGPLSQALATGIAHSASKLVRGVGTTLLPKSAEAWLEGKGILPTAADVALLGEGVSASPAARIADTASDVAADMLPMSRALRGARTMRQSLPRSAAVGGALSGVRAESEDVPEQALFGALGGVGGDLAGRGIVGAASRLVRPSTGARSLMDEGVIPSLGQGVDRTRLTGRALGFIEDQMESMPLSGLPIRAARGQSNDQLFNAALDRGTTVGRPSPTGTRLERIAASEQPAMDAREAALRGTSMVVSPGVRHSINNAVTQASQGLIGPQAEAAIIQQLNGRLASAARNGTVSAEAVNALIEDLYKGTMSRGDSAVQTVLERIAPRFKSWLDRATTQAGHDLPQARQTLTNMYALRRARGSDTGVSGQQLAAGVEANDRAVNARVMGSATPDLRDLADLATALRTPSNAMRSRNVAQVVGDYAKEGAMGMIGGHLPIAAYGAANFSPTVRAWLMGHPETVANIIRRTSPLAASAGVESLGE